MIVLVCLLGVLQAVMQGMLFYDSFKAIDMKYKIKWFSIYTNNQNEWSIKIFGKQYFIFKYFPFIMFVDLFHFCHSTFGLTLALLVSLFTINKLLWFVIVGLCYSVSFEIMLRLMKFLRNSLKV